MNLRERAKQLERDIPAVLLALRKRETPWAAKALAALAVGYALSPIDLIPDFIPVLGYLDDVILLPFLITAAIRLIPQEVMEQCRKEAGQNSGRRKRWRYAIPVFLIWLLILALVIKAIFF